MAPDGNVYTKIIAQASLSKNCCWEWRRAQTIERELCEFQADKRNNFWYPNKLKLSSPTHNCHRLSPPSFFSLRAISIFIDCVEPLITRFASYFFFLHGIHIYFFAHYEVLLIFQHIHSSLAAAGWLWEKPLQWKKNLSSIILTWIAKKTSEQKHRKILKITQIADQRASIHGALALCEHADVIFVA